MLLQTSRGVFDLWLCLPAKKASKFRDWLDCSALEVKPNSVAMEILSYLAYETVAQARRRSVC